MDKTTFVPVACFLSVCATACSHSRLPSETAAACGSLEEEASPPLASPLSVYVLFEPGKTLAATLTGDGRYTLRMTGSAALFPLKEIGEYAGKDSSLASELYALAMEVFPKTTPLESTSPDTAVFEVSMPDGSQRSFPLYQAPPSVAAWRERFIGFVNGQARTCKTHTLAMTGRLAQKTVGGSTHPIVEVELRNTGRHDILISSPFPSAFRARLSQTPFREDGQDYDWRAPGQLQIAQMAGPSLTSNSVLLPTGAALKVAVSILPAMAPGDFEGRLTYSSAPRGAGENPGPNPNIVEGVLDVEIPKLRVRP